MLHTKMTKLQNNISGTEYTQQNSQQSQPDINQTIIAQIQQNISSFKEKCQNQNKKMQKLQQQQKDIQVKHQQTINDMQKNHNDNLARLRQGFEEQLSQKAQQHGKSLDQMKAKMQVKEVPAPIIQVVEQKPIQVSAYDQNIQTNLKQEEITSMEAKIQQQQQVIESLNTKQEEILQQNNDLKQQIEKLKSQLAGVQEENKQHQLKVKVVKILYQHDPKFNIPIQHISIQQEPTLAQKTVLPTMYDNAVQCELLSPETQNKGQTQSITFMEMHIEDLRSRILRYSRQIAMYFDEMYQQKEQLNALQIKTKIQRVYSKYDRKFQVPFQIGAQAAETEVRQEPQQLDPDKTNLLEQEIQKLKEQLSQQSIDYKKEIYEIENKKQELQQELEQLQNQYNILQQQDSDKAKQITQYLLQLSTFEQLQRQLDTSGQEADKLRQENINLNNQLEDLKEKIQNLMKQHELQLQDLQKSQELIQEPEKSFTNIPMLLQNSQIDNIKSIMLQVLKEKYNEADDLVLKYQLHEISESVNLMQSNEIQQLYRFSNVQELKQKLTKFKGSFWLSPQIKSKDDLINTILFGQNLTVQHICLVFTKQFNFYDISDIEWKYLLGVDQDNFNSNVSTTQIMKQSLSGQKNDIRKIKLVSGLFNDPFFVIYRISDGKIFKTTTLTKEFIENIVTSSLLNQSQSQIIYNNCYDIILYTNQPVPISLFYLPIRKLNYINFGQPASIFLKYPQQLMYCAISSVSILNLQNCVNLVSLQSEKVTYDVSQLINLQHLSVFVSKYDTYTEVLSKINSQTMSSMIQTLMKTAKLQFACINSGQNIIQSLVIDFRQMQLMKSFISINNRNIVIDVITNALDGTQDLQNINLSLNNSPIPYLKFIQAENSKVNFIGDQTIIQNIEKQLLPLKIKV